MKKFSIGWRWLMGLLWVCILSHGYAQSLDASFQPTVLKNSIANTITRIGGTANSATQVVKQPDGKLLIAGGFDYVNGVMASKIQRLNADGTTDASFNPTGVGANGTILAMVLQLDGKIIIGGAFTAYNDAPATMIARLNSNGTLDPTFTSADVGPIRDIYCLALQPDGKILVGSSKKTGVLQPQTGVMRLNSDGTRDTSFNVGLGINRAQAAVVYTLLVQADGKIVVGGFFGVFDTRVVGNLVRLNADGSLDTTFMVGTGTVATGSGGINRGIVRSLAQQPDGKLIIGGDFTGYNGAAAPRLVRLLLNGTLDTTFAVNAGFPGGGVYSILVQNTGSILVGGTFTGYNGVASMCLARISSTGVLDTAFGSAGGPSSGVSRAVELANNQLVVVGYFNQYQGQNRTNIARLDANGTLDTTFAPTVEIRGTLSSATPLANGAVLVTGSYKQFNGTAVAANTVQRLNPDGTLDLNYTTTAVSAMGVQPDGSFYTTALSSSSPSLFQLQRILPSGAVDNTFSTQPFLGTTSPGVIVQPDGRILVFGYFSSVNGAPRNGIVRFLPTGALDNSFVPPITTGSNVVKAFLQPDGKVVISYGSNSLVRLNTDGTLDNTFSANVSMGQFFSVLVQPNGQLLVYQQPTFYNDQDTLNFVRLTATGAIDNSFAPAVGYTPWRVQPDGRILATHGRYSAATLVRVNINGSLDNTFTPIYMPEGIWGGDMLGGVELQPADGKILLWGSFHSMLGQLRSGLARVNSVGVSAVQGTKAIVPLAIYPNPAQQSFSVKMPAVTGKVEAALFDVHGRKVQNYSWLPSLGEANVDVSSLINGIYILRLSTAQKTYVQRVVVTH